MITFVQRWLFLFLTLGIGACAFQAQKQRLTTGVGAAIHHQSRRHRHLLFFSDFPQNNEEAQESSTAVEETKNRQKRKKKKSLVEFPPSPEDIFTLTGDLIALTVYGFVDHLICNDLSSFMVHRATTIPKLERLLPHSYSVPVWTNPTTSHLQHTMQNAASDRWIVQYSGPLLYTGSAVVLLATCWLVTGYLLQSFAFRNTLQCRTDHALLVTGSTWIVSTAVALTVVLLFGSPTQADMIFLADSLSVLTLWRFMANSMFGSSSSRDE